MLRSYNACHHISFPCHRRRHSLASKTYIIVFLEDAFENQPLYIGIARELRVNHATTSLQAHNHLTHHLEFLPIDSTVVVADKGSVALLGRNKVSPVKGQERDPLRRGVFPSKTIGKMATLCSHQDLQPHEVFLCLCGHEFPGLCEPVDGTTIDASNDRSKSVVVIQISQLLQCF